MSYKSRCLLFERRTGLSSGGGRGGQGATTHSIFIKHDSIYKFNINIGLFKHFNFFLKQFSKGLIGLFKI